MWLHLHVSLRCMLFLRLLPYLLFLLRLLLLLHMRALTPMHVAHNSWSDTGRVKGPTGRRSAKGGVSGPTEDLHPVPEVEAGGNFRPAGGVRGQVAGSLSGKQPGTGTRRQRVGVVTPSLHLEVPGLQFVSPGHGLEIRQSMGWTKVCETARSGIWVLKGNARARMLPASLDHLRVGWRKQGTYETALGYARARLSVSIRVWTWSSRQTIN